MECNKLFRGSVRLLDEKFGFGKITYYRKESFSMFSTARPDQ
jgi:hypothetical protein